MQRRRAQLSTSTPLAARATRTAAGRIIWDMGSTVAHVPEEEHGFGLSSRQMLLDVGSGLHRTGGERELSLISKGKKR